MKTSVLVYLSICEIIKKNQCNYSESAWILEFCRALHFCFALFIFDLTVYTKKDLPITSLSHSSFSATVHQMLQFNWNLIKEKN